MFDTAVLDVFVTDVNEGPALVPQAITAVEADIKAAYAFSPALADLIRRMLNPDPAKRITLAHARSHPWVTPAIPAVMGAIGAPKGKSLLISDDPATDMNEAVLTRCNQLGFKRSRVTEAVLSRAKTAISTAYYLLLSRMGRVCWWATSGAARCIHRPCLTT